jgi:uncharacterized membrane protein YhaH (DUF805 family)
MAFSNHYGRIGQARYWKILIASTVGSVALLVGALAAFVGREFAIAFALLLAVFPIGLYLLVAQMRRCSDIGWPSQLPLIFMGSGVFASSGTLLEVWDNPGELPRFDVSMLFGLATWAFAATIGCIPGRPGRADNDETIGPDSGDDTPTFSSTTEPADRDEVRDARWSAAIQKALDASSGPPRPAGPTRPGGFGRRRAA